METVAASPSPTEFYDAFLSAVQPQQQQLPELWDKWREHKPVMFALFSPIAEALGLCCYARDYYTFDTIFYKERDIANFDSQDTYATFISVALEHENDCNGTAVEMNKLQLLNAPLKVLITYPYKKRGKNDAESLLSKYARIVSAADVFQDFSTLRRQLVIFGWKEDRKVIWKGFEYANGVFIEIQLPATVAQGAP